MNFIFKSSKILLELFYRSEFRSNGILSGCLVSENAFAFTFDNKNVIYCHFCILFYF